MCCASRIRRRQPRAMRRTTSSDQPIPVEPKNIDYWFCGDASLKPTAASDDGMHTRLTFAAKAEQPAIFVLNEDGTESLLNFSMDEGDVIVHRVARRFILRRGNLAGCIVNKGFAGSGDRLKSNTVDDGCGAHDARQPAHEDFVQNVRDPDAGRRQERRHCRRAGSRSPVTAASRRSIARVPSSRVCRAYWLSGSCRRWVSGS